MWKLKPPYMAICVVYCLAAVVKSAELETFSKEFRDFDETYYNIFEVIGSAKINYGALQLTPNSASSATPDSTMPPAYYSGRIMLPQPFKLWDDDANSASSSIQPNLASFNISFLFNIKPRNVTTATGLAFVIAPDLLVLPNSFGPFLGLTSSFKDGISSNQLVAVEFDAFKDYFDPDDNHVGIDVNSIISVKTASLTPHNITIAPEGFGFCNAWVDYDGLNKVMDVYIAEQYVRTGATPSKPGSPMLPRQPPKKQRLPLSVARVAMKKQQEREEKMLQERLILGRFGAFSSSSGGKRVNERRRPEDRVLKATEGNFRNGVLDVKHMLQPSAPQASNDHQASGKGKKKKGGNKRKGGGKKRH